MAGGIVVHRFGPFELDPASGRLFRGPRRVPLSDTQAAILVQLVSNVGEVVSREALIEAAWGNTAVTENSLRQAIRRLRQALGDGRNGALYIETLRTRGFRFAAAVQRGERDAARVPLEAQLAPFRAFVQGRSELDRLDRDALRRARHAFDDALRQAPGYAPAHVGLAMACGLEFEATTPDVRRDTAPLVLGIEHAHRGCALDPASGEAWSTLAFVLYLNGDTEHAAAAACKAMALEPDDWRHALRAAYVSWGEERVR